MRPVGVQAPTTVVRHPADAVRPYGPTSTSNPSLHVPLPAQPHLRPCGRVRSPHGNLHGIRHYPPWPRTHRHRGHPSDRRNRPAPTSAAPQEHQLTCSQQTSPHRVKITNGILKAIQNHFSAVADTQSRPSPGSHPAPRLPPRSWALCGPHQEGHGLPKHTTVYNGGSPSGMVRDVKWTSWGEERTTEQDNPSTPPTGWPWPSSQLERRGAPRGVRTAAALPPRRREPARRSGASCRRWTCPAWCAGPGSWPRVLRGSCARRWS
jgi:hypothetical protein